MGFALKCQGQKVFEGFVYLKPCCSWLSAFEEISAELSKDVDLEKKSCLEASVTKSDRHFSSVNCHRKENKRRKKHSDQSISMAMLENDHH